jgi:hypothetical protein
VSAPVDWWNAGKDSDEIQRRLNDAVSAPSLAAIQANGSHQGQGWTPYGPVALTDVNDHYGANNVHLVDSDTRPNFYPPKPDPGPAAPPTSSADQPPGQEGLTRNGMPPELDPDPGAQTDAQAAPSPAVPAVPSLLSNTHDKGSRATAAAATPATPFDFNAINAQPKIAKRTEDDEDELPLSPQYTA